MRQAGKAIESGGFDLFRRNFVANYRINHNQLGRA
jgi:hypothetical protein